MARFLFIPKCIYTKRKTHNGENKENSIERRAEICSRQGIPFWFMPSVSYALQSHINESRQQKYAGNTRVRRVWQTCNIQMVQTIPVGRIGRAERERWTRSKAFDEFNRYGGSEGSSPRATTKHKNSQGKVGGRLQTECKRYDIQTFFRIIGARYKRIRIRPRGIPSPQLVDLKTLQLQELVKLWKEGLIDLRFGDESHVCTSGYVPYGWQFDDEDVFVPAQKEQRLNIFGMVSPDCVYDGFDTTESITGELLADYLDDFSKKIVKPTFIVLDNASIHRKGVVAKMRDIWKERGLYLFFLPPYCPHLNIAETVWRILKGKWLQPHHYCSRTVLHETTREILAGIGTEYVINFAHAA